MPPGQTRSGCTGPDTARNVLAWATQVSTYHQMIPVAMGARIWYPLLAVIARCCLCLQLRRLFQADQVPALLLPDVTMLGLLARLYPAHATLACAPWQSFEVWFCLCLEFETLCHHTRRSALRDGACAAAGWNRSSWIRSLRQYVLSLLSPTCFKPAFAICLQEAVCCLTQTDANRGSLEQHHIVSRRRGPRQHGPSFQLFPLLRSGEF
jgi:hypothetical protein